MTPDMTEQDWAILAAMAACIDLMRSGHIRLGRYTPFSVEVFQSSLIEEQ